MIQKCEKCKYVWDYKGSFSKYSTCPKCKKPSGAYYKEYYKEHIRGEIFCKKCGDKIKVGSNNHKYCSNKCKPYNPNSNSYKKHIQEEKDKYRFKKMILKNTPEKEILNEMLRLTKDIMGENK